MGSSLSTTIHLTSGRLRGQMETSTTGNKGPKGKIFVDPTYNPLIPHEKPKELPNPTPLHCAHFGLAEKFPGKPTSASNFLYLERWFNHTNIF